MQTGHRAAEAGKGVVEKEVDEAMEEVVSQETKAVVPEMELK